VTNKTDFAVKLLRDVELSTEGVSALKKKLAGATRFKTFQETVKELGHTNRTIDKFKMGEQLQKEELLQASSRLRSLDRLVQEPG
jgi:tRNA U38,U39,U40 pseudouridine synthase TruA